MTERVYLDWNATAPLSAEARDAMIAAMDVVGNPASVHGEGRAVKALVEKAREDIAAGLGAKARDVVFTAGATEAASVLKTGTREHAVCVETTSHDALWSHFDLTGADSAPAEPGHVLAMGLANSETGVITPPPAKRDGQWPYGALGCDSLLLDVTQAVGRIPFGFEWSGADLAVLSAHKLGGPKGVGALLVREGLDISPLTTGGGQEMGRRSGTENVLGIVGFAAALKAALRDLEQGIWGEVEKLRNILESGLASCENETIFVGKDLTRLPNTSCLATPGWKGETQVMQMDLAGFAVSSGSACSSGKVRESRVLRSMGFDEDTARSAIRVSLGPTTTEDDVMRFVEAWSLARARHKARAA